MARVPEFVERWTRIGLSSVPIDHAQAERALCRLYQAAGLAEPRVVWAPCPMTAMLSAIVYTAIRATGREAQVRDQRALAAFVDRIIRSALVATIPAEMHRRMRRYVEEAVASALKLGRPKGGGFDAALAISDWRRAALDRVLGRSLAPALQTRLRRLLLAPIRKGPVRVLRSLVEPALDRAAQGVVGLRTRAGWAYFGAPRRVAYAAQMDYLDRVLGIRLDRSLIDAVEACGLFWVLSDLCFAAKRPTHLNRDEAGHPHCEIGPALSYPSAWSWWHWHGVQVSQAIIEAPETITTEAIHRVGNAELRRVMVERYRSDDKVHGIAAYLSDAGARRLDHDPDFGTLWRLAGAHQEPLLMVEVTNRSPEPDGTHRRFLLRVDPELRPMLGRGSFGPPQIPTARNAVASTFGMSGVEYLPEVET